MRERKKFFLEKKNQKFPASWRPFIQAQTLRFLLLFFKKKAFLSLVDV